MNAGRPDAAKAVCDVRRRPTAVRAMCSSMGTSSTLPHESESCVCQELRNLDPWSSSLGFQFALRGHGAPLEATRAGAKVPIDQSPMEPATATVQGRTALAGIRTRIEDGRMEPRGTDRGLSRARPSATVDVGDRMRRDPPQSSQHGAPPTSAAAPCARSRAGLSSAEVERRRRTGGRNVLPRPARRSALRQLLAQMDALLRRHCCGSRRCSPSSPACRNWVSPSSSWSW